MKTKNGAQPLPVKGPSSLIKPVETDISGTMTTDVSDTTLIILPDPVGYQMLVALPTIKEKTDAGIIIPDAVTTRERAAAVVGKVIAIGDMAYQDAKRFTLGKPWCKVGDTVMFARYTGMRFQSMDQETKDMVEYRMIPDDGIVGVVPQGAKVGAI